MGPSPSRAQLPNPTLMQVEGELGYPKSIWAQAKPGSDFGFVTELSQAHPAKTFWLKPARDTLGYSWSLQYVTVKISQCFVFCTRLRKYQYLKSTAGTAGLTSHLISYLYFLMTQIFSYYNGWVWPIQNLTYCHLSKYPPISLAGSPDHSLGQTGKTFVSNFQLSSSRVIHDSFFKY